MVVLTALMHRFAVRPKPLLLLKAIMLRRQMFLEESMSSFPDWVCFSSVEAGPCYSDEKKVLLILFPSALGEECIMKAHSLLSHSPLSLSV